jgi:predicted transcriptional regulator
MCLVKYIYRLKRIDALIFMKATGTPEEFAEKLGIKRSTLYQSLQEMRDMGVDIRYSCTRQSYYYADERRIRITVEAESDILGPV